MGEDVQVGVVEDGADDARLEELALLLRQELLTLDVRAVEPYREGEAPDGSRGGLAAIAGVLSVSLAPGLQVLGSVVSVVRDWLRRSGSGRTVKLTIDGDVDRADRRQRRGAAATGRCVRTTRTPERTREMDGSRVALVVANDQYDDPGLRRLVAPAQDAAALAEVLADPSVGGFEVQVLHNESAQEIRFAVEDFFADRAPEDLLLLHFSCHGLEERGRRAVPGGRGHQADPARVDRGGRGLRQPADGGQPRAADRAVPGLLLRRRVPARHGRPRGRRGAGAGRLRRPGRGRRRARPGDRDGVQRDGVRLRGRPAGDRCVRRRRRCSPARSWTG